MRTQSTTTAVACAGIGKRAWAVRVAALAVLATCVASLGAERAEAADGGWPAAMKQVHAKFTGEQGTFALLGDSITVSLAFWANLDSGKLHGCSAEMTGALELVRDHMKRECWREWRGPQFGNQGRMTIRWAHENVDAWLEKLNPEAAVIMFGTNDLGKVPLDEYEAKYREVLEKILANGTVVILSTIPPKHRNEEKAKAHNEVLHKLAAELQIPLCDYYGEILRRRPDDWNGKLEKFDAVAGAKGYDVPTLISRDGVHPSNPEKYRGDFSEEGLSNSGYNLRSYVVLMSYAEVIRNVFKSQ